MANTLRLKRSSVASKVPLTTDLQLGELAINTFDGKLFLKKDNGTASIVEIGAGGGGGASVTISDTAPSSPSAGNLWWNSSEGQMYIYYNDGNTSQWVIANAFVGSSVAYLPITGGTVNGNLNVSTSGTLGNSSLNANLGVVARVDTAGVTPYFQLYNSNAGSNQKTWRIGGGSSGQLVFETVNDAYSAATERARLDSSGNLLFNSGYGSVATAYGCRAWVNFNGTSTVAIRASGNVTSITDNGVGDYTVNFTNAMPDVNYSAVGAVKELDNTNISSVFLNIGANQTVANTYATGSIRVTTQSGTTKYDSVVVNVAIFR